MLPAARVGLRAAVKDLHWGGHVIPTGATLLYSVCATGEVHRATRIVPCGYSGRNAWSVCLRMVDHWVGILKHSPCKPGWYVA